MPCDRTGVPTAYPEDVTTDDEPWAECAVCEYNWTLKPRRDDVLRFVEHSHDKFYKGRLMPVQCEGSYHTPEEAREIRKAQPPSDPSQRPH